MGLKEQLKHRKRKIPINFMESKLEKLSKGMTLTLFDQQAAQLLSQYISSKNL